MEFYDIKTFNSSHLMVRAEEVFGYGQYLESWITKSQYKKLYSYSNYYVEILYNNEHKKIADIRAIDLDTAIDAYVSNKHFERELDAINAL